MTLTYGVLPKRDEFERWITDPEGVDIIDPDRKGPLFPEEGYRISFGADVGFFERFSRAVNEGIDAHLEAVTWHSGWSKGRQVFWIESPGSMHTLLRRMVEHAETLECSEDRCLEGCAHEEAMREVSDILYSLGIEWC